MASLLALRDFRMIAPDLNRPSFAKLDFDSMVESALRAAPSPDVIIGSSMGSLVALEIARRGAGAPLVLIAPAIGIHERFLSGIPEGDPVEMFHYGSERNERIHRRFFEQVSSLTVDFEPPPVRVSVFMGTNDQTLPFEMVADQWNAWASSGRLVAGSRFVTIPGGDHRLADHVTLFADEVVSVTETTL